MLTSVHIKNFRSCKDVKLEGLGHISALVGRNGAGKTTILRAIEWIAGTALLTEGFSAAFENAEEGEGLDTQITVGLTDGETEYRYRASRLFSHPPGRRGRRSAQIEEELLIRIPDGDWGTIFVREDDRVVLADREQPIELHQSAVMPGLVSLLHGSPLHAFLLPVMDVLRGVRYYLGHGVIDPAYYLQGDVGSPIRTEFYERWVAENERRGNDDLSLLLRIIHAHQTAPEAFAELKSRLGPEGLGVIRDIRVNVLGDIAETVRKRRSRYFEVVFEPMGQENVELSLGQISRGTQQMLYLMLGLLFDRSSTMLVEQPEDGIHPALLAKLIDLLKVNAYPTQIILASHSPTVLSQLQPADVRIVEMIDGSTRVRALTEAEVTRALEYMQRDGSLAEFLELIQD